MNTKAGAVYMCHQYYHIHAPSKFHAQTQPCQIPSQIGHLSWLQALWILAQGLEEARTGLGQLLCRHSLIKGSGKTKPGHPLQTNMVQSPHRSRNPGGHQGLADLQSCLSQTSNPFIQTISGHSINVASSVLQDQSSFQHISELWLSLSDWDIAVSLGQVVDIFILTNLSHLTISI